ncbi:MAG: dihydroorotate dehydrogenase [Planctomycetes bacterium]|nr:dihydroorotate dehydrogenase [Planctomycetota bacterium]
MSASGTFGSGWEGRTFADLSRVGALVSKTVTLRPRHGNPPPRIFETPAGMLNSIGLENKGVDWFLADTLPKMKSLGTTVIVNIGGEAIDEFVVLAERFSRAGVDALEVNLSCPNVQEGRLLFSTEPRLTEQAVAAVKRVATVPVFAKLSPNVTDITAIARAAEQGGADGITAINTLIGMAIDWRRRRPVLGRGIGGLSGPAIKPVALRMVWEIARVVKIPVLGVGGIRSAEDVLEFLCAGATAVQVGTAGFADPALMVRIVDELPSLLAAANVTLADVRGALHAAPAAAPAEGCARAGHERVRG